MNLTKNITLALGLLSAGVSHAQTTPAGGEGLLGHRYTELSFGLQDLKHVSDHGYSVGASANNPLIPGVLDAGASYSYSWIRGPFRGHANTVGGYAIAYAPFNGVKPFVGAGLGYQWTSFSFGGSDDQALWGLTAGVEFPAGPRVTITPRINYADDFEASRNSTQAWTYQVEANYWFNSKSAVFGSVGKSDVRRSPIDSWNYEIGLRARF
ncbi:MAG: porin [Opitutaceae bacterium]